jgi:hypothetical protein
MSSVELFLYIERINYYIYKIYSHGDQKKKKVTSTILTTVPLLNPKPFSNFTVPSLFPPSTLYPCSTSQSTDLLQSLYAHGRHHRVII